ncbi:hypothetical protein NP233_g4844 [Leucocoprinus birnbaumii]|uniref:NACHT domain-containing protein n=1 Tax=Leucocoprinus birnbaumii TaxID=56174 RepID=A0AAD5VXL8_9AGAR|nr:hypothetical protein NP233_g4844 [Leucocoprinus birnbaumii]
MQPRPREVSPAPSGSSDQELKPSLPSRVPLSAHDQLPSSPTPPLPRATPPYSPLPHPTGYNPFDRAHDFIIKDAHFVDKSQTGHAIDPRPRSLDILFKHSMPDAFHNSLARYPPPRCHLGTREEYIKLIIQWALGESDHKEPVLWLRGPFGVGKSAIAQTGAESLKPLDKLLATLFFSRSNADRDEPLRVFPSIVYQIASLCQPFAGIIDMILQKDPSITTKSLPIQFEELIVIPLQQIDATKNGLEGGVVIIDGLDECRGTMEQREIIRIIATSARNRTTPFRWFITSRPEELIIWTMNAPSISSVVYSVELPVSREIDHEILLFLTDEFAKIRENHGLPDSWPSEEVLILLVDHTDGLWIYISTMVRFVKDENSLGPVDQLRIVLKFIGDVSNRYELPNPFAEMDFLYSLIMQRIPSIIQTRIRRILLLHSLGRSVGAIARSLGLSGEEIGRNCAFLQSVMELRGNDLCSFELHFYHASFVHFLTDVKRSGDLSIRGEFLIQYRRELLEWLHFVCSHSTDSSHFIFPAGKTLPKDMEPGEHYQSVVNTFWVLCCTSDHPIDVPTAAAISNLPFQKMLRLVPEGSHCAVIDENALNQNLPVEFRDRIIRRGEYQAPGYKTIHPIYIFGHGDNEAFAHTISLKHIAIENDRNVESIDRGEEDSEPTDGVDKPLIGGGDAPTPDGPSQSQTSPSTQESTSEIALETASPKKTQRKGEHILFRLLRRFGIRKVREKQEGVEAWAQRSGKEQGEHELTEGGMERQSHRLVQNAIHDGVPRARCAPGTRTKHIQEFFAWSMNTESAKHRMLWIEGPAGAGKTAFTNSCAMEAEKQGTLGASFFFSHENGVVDSTCFLVTICHQLAQKIEGFENALQRSLHDNPMISESTSTLDEQFRRLIVDPFLELCGQYTQIRPRTILIDGLDECQRVPTQSTIVEMVAKSIRAHGSQIPLQWVFVSRPEPHLARLFASPLIFPICQRIQLEVSTDLDAEIQVYFQSRFGIGNMSIPVVRASDEDLKILVKIVAGFYFYAAAIADFIVSPQDILGSQKRLQVVLSLSLGPNTSSAPAITSISGSLDALYRSIMNGIPMESLSVVQQALLIYCDSRDGFPMGRLPMEYLAALYFLVNHSRSREFWVEHERHWDAVAVKGLRLLDGMTRMRGIPEEIIAPCLRKLFYFTQSDLGGHSDLMEFSDGLYEYLRQNIVRWCGRSSNGEYSTALQSLQRNKFEILRRAWIAVEPDLLSQFPVGIRPGLKAIPRIMRFPTPEQENMLNKPPKPSVYEEDSMIEVYVDFVLDTALSSAYQQSSYSTFRKFIDELSALGRVDVVHSRVQSHLINHFRLLAKESKYDVDGTSLFGLYVDEWVKYDRAMSSIFWNHESLKKVSMLVWETEFYRPLQSETLQLTEAALHLINCWRRRELISNQPRAFVQSLCNMSNVAHATPRHSFSEVYSVDFRNRFLKNTREIYSREEAFVSDDTLLANLQRVGDCLDKERELLFSLDLPLYDQSNCLQHCLEILLGGHLEAIYAEFRTLLMREGEADGELRCIYLVTYPHPAASKQLCEILRVCVQETLTATIARFTTNNGAIVNSEACALAVCEDHDRFLGMIHRIFMGEHQFKRSINQALDHISLMQSEVKGWVRVAQDA